MRVLIACEESQRVCIAFRKRGHEAYSCDILDPTGGHQEWHIKGDVLPLINGDCLFKTMDEVEHQVVGAWDLLIAHPPCTYLTVTGNSWFDINKYGDKARLRYKERYKAIVFFTQIASSTAKKWAIENPIGIMSTAFGKPQQIIQPYMFGDAAEKKLHSGFMVFRCSFRLMKLNRRSVCDIKAESPCHLGMPIYGNCLKRNGRSSAARLSPA